MTRRQMVQNGKEIECELITPLTSHESLNRYELPDGTILSLRLVVTEVWKAVTEKDKEGNPLFMLKSSNVLTVILPQTGKTGGPH